MPFFFFPPRPVVAATGGAAVPSLGALTGFSPSSFFFPALAPSFSCGLDASGGLAQPASPSFLPAKFFVRSPSGDFLGIAACSRKGAPLLESRDSHVLENQTGRRFFPPGFFLSRGGPHHSATLSFCWPDFLRLPVFAFDGPPLRRPLGSPGSFFTS